MESDDFITLATPEGIELELSLAGLGSRLVAGGLDLGVRLVLLLAATLALDAAGDLGGALLAIVAFLVLIVYDVPFEVLGAGQTPGKRIARLRVVRSDGSPVDLRGSAVRNIARLVDGLTLAYIPTVVGILVTEHNQRPGDLAADTVVIRAPKPQLERRRRRRRAPADPDAAAASVAADWDVSAITPAELAIVRRFLDRRESLAREARRALALRLAAGLRPRVGGAPPGEPAERFLETLAATKAARSGLLAPPHEPH